jgi:hypothetical protein
VGRGEPLAALPARHAAAVGAVVDRGAVADRPRHRLAGHSPLDPEQYCTLFEGIVIPMCHAGLPPPRSWGLGPQTSMPFHRPAEARTHARSRTFPACHCLNRDSSKTATAGFETKPLNLVTHLCSRVGVTGTLTHLCYRPEDCPRMQRGWAGRVEPAAPAVVALAPDIRHGIGGGGAAVAGAAPDVHTRLQHGQAEREGREGREGRQVAVGGLGGSVVRLAAILGRAERCARREWELRAPSWTWRRTARPAVCFGSACRPAPCPLAASWKRAHRAQAACPPAARML